MKEQKDRHLEAPGEANRDKHINFLAEEMGDADPANENFDNDEKSSNNRNDVKNVDNGFFTDDNNRLQTKQESENGKNIHHSAQKGKVVPIDPDTHTTLGDKISINKNNDDILTHVRDDQNPAYTNETSQEQ